METGRGYEFPVSSFQFPFFPYLTPDSCFNRQSSIDNRQYCSPGTAPATKGPPKKKPKKLLTAHFVGAKLPVIITSLVKVVNTQQGGEAGAMRKQEKASRGSRRRYLLR